MKLTTKKGCCLLSQPRLLGAKHGSVDTPRLNSELGSIELLRFEEAQEDGKSARLLGFLTLDVEVPALLNRNSHFRFRKAAVVEERPQPSHGFQYHGSSFIPKEGDRWPDIRCPALPLPKESAPWGLATTWP